MADFSNIDTLIDALANSKEMQEVQQTSTAQNDMQLLNLSNPDDFRKAFIASEILNRKY
jgi:hypothetical protein